MTSSISNDFFLTGGTPISVPNQGGRQAASSDDTDFKFLLEPEESYYITKNKPATISCKAVGVHRISFKCVGQWIEPSRHVTVVNDTDVKTLAVSIEVAKNEVEEYVGPAGYWCECYAWNAKTHLTRKSKRGLIQIACECSIIIITIIVIVVVVIVIVMVVVILDVILYSELLKLLHSLRMSKEHLSFLIIVLNYLEKYLDRNQLFDVFGELRDLVKLSKWKHIVKISS